MTLIPKSVILYICSGRYNSSVIKCCSALRDRIPIPDSTRDYVKVQAGSETR
jgi:hypothetical protein